MIYMCHSHYSAFWYLLFKIKKKIFSILLKNWQKNLLRHFHILRFFSLRLMTIGKSSWSFSKNRFWICWPFFTRIFFSRHEFLFPVVCFPFSKKVFWRHFNASIVCNNLGKTPYLGFSQHIAVFSHGIFSIVIEVKKGERKCATTKLCCSPGYQQQSR